MLNRFCLFSVLAIAPLLTAHPAWAGRPHQSHPGQHRPAPQPAAQPVPENDYGYWSTPPVQRSNQAAEANAIATGDHARATSNVNQFNYQSHYGSGYSGNSYGSWAVPSIQISVQQGTANAVATGNNSTAASHLNQTNYAENGYGSGYESGYDGGYGGGYWPDTQSSNQQAVGNAIATGDNSTAISNIDQYNNQYYGYPSYIDYGYGGY